MIGTLGFYEQITSQLLPPACRFVTTYSQYGVQAIEQLGPVNGGYDPPVYVAHTEGLCTCGRTEGGSTCCAGKVG